MKRRLFSILLTLALCLGLMPLGAVEVHAATEVDSGTCGANVTWTLDDEGLLTISGTGEMEGGAYAGNYGSHHAEIKSAVFGSGVTNVGSSAFYRRKKIGSTDYEELIFSNLTNVQLSDTIKSIGANAFYKTTIDSITIPNSVTVLDNQAFEESGFTNLVLPDSVVSIGYRAFASAKRLEEVTLPDTLTNLSASVFAGCTALETIHFNGVIKSIDDSAFYGCTALPSLKLAVDGKDASIGNNVFYNVGSNVVTIYGIPGGTVESGASAKNYTFVTAQNNFKFDANGGSGSMADLLVTFNSADNGNFPANTFTYDGKVFTGWNTKADGSGIPVEDKTAVRILGVNGDITLYAQWEDAPVVPYDLYIAGTQVTSANAEDVFGDGKVSYDAGTKTLTLNGVSLTSGGSDSQVWGDESDADRVYAPLFSNIQGLTIQVTGENTLTSAGDPGQEPGLGQGGSLSCGIFSLQDLTFTGSGTLNAVGGAARITHGIFSLGDLTVGDTFTGTLSATGGAAKSSSYGILGEKNITITGSGTVIAAGGDATATNGARSVGIYCYDYDNGVLTVGGNAQVTATSGKAETGQSYGVRAKQVIVKDSAELTAAAGKAVKSSSSITTLSHGIDADTLTISDNAKVTATSGEVSGGESSYGVKLSQKATVSGGSLIAEGVGGDTCEFSRGLQTPGNSGYGLYITDGTVFLTGGPTKDGGYGFGFAGGDLSLTGGSLTAKTEAAEGSAIKTYGTYNVAVEPVMASTAADGTGAADYVAANNDTYKWFQAPFDDQEIPTEPTQVATPVLPAPAEFTDSKAITITCETEGASIYYTTGGAITLYEGAFDITETTTVEAYATKDGLDESEHVTAKYTKVDPTPTPSTGGTTTYPVKPASAENGNVTVAPRNAAEKAKVTITVTPDEGYVLDKLTVKDKDGKEIDVKDNGDGTYTFTMPASAIEIEATFKPEEGAATDGFPFIDVPENSYFRKPVEWAVEKGITNGVSEDKYGPEMSCTRAQVVTFLWITCGSEDAGIETGFDDVDVTAYYDKAVAWAMEKGVTAGTSENEFSPDMTITRAQFVTMLWAAKGMPEVAGEMPFLDVPSDAYYAKAVAWAYANDITAGKSADSFAPDDPCTRAQIMTFLYNAYGE